MKSNKQPIIIFGANWCPDCRIFSGTMDIPKIKSYIDDHFAILYIDVKRYEINMQLMEEFGIPSAEGIPRVLVFDKRNLIQKFFRLYQLQPLNYVAFSYKFYLQNLTLIIWDFYFL